MRLTKEKVNELMRYLRKGHSILAKVENKSDEILKLTNTLGYVIFSLTTKFTHDTVVNARRGCKFILQNEDDL